MHSVTIVVYKLSLIRVPVEAVISNAFKLFSRETILLRNYRGFLYLWLIAIAQVDACSWI